MNPQLFFAALDVLARTRTTAFDWQRAMTPQFPLALPFLRTTGRFAKAVHCHLGCGCAHEVIEGTSPPTAVCVCDKGNGGCEDIEFQPGDLEILELDFERLGHEAARALNCRPRCAPLGANGLWQIGAWSNEGIPVLMAAGMSAPRLDHALATAAARLRTRLILLVSNISLVTPACRELLAPDRSGVFGLDSLLCVSAPGRFRAIRAPEDVFAAFTTDSAGPDDGGVQKAFALIQKLEAKSPSTPPGLVTVFKLYCMDELSALDVARRCGCSKSTIVDRLARIRKATGMNPASFRGLSPGL